jgi:hypothetical protein
MHRQEPEALIANSPVPVNGSAVVPSWDQNGKPNRKKQPFSIRFNHHPFSFRPTRSRQHLTTAEPTCCVFFKAYFISYISYSPPTSLSTDILLFSSELRPALRVCDTPPTLFGIHSFIPVASRTTIKSFWIAHQTNRHPTNALRTTTTVIRRFINIIITNDHVYHSFIRSFLSISSPRQRRKRLVGCL